jgi:hypothetical protein
MELTEITKPHGNYHNCLLVCWFKWTAEVVNIFFPHILLLFDEQLKFSFSHSHMGVVNSKHNVPNPLVPICTFLAASGPFFVTFRKVGSSNKSHLEAHAGFFRLFMKGIFYPYVLKVDFLISNAR